MRTCEVPGCRSIEDADVNMRFGKRAICGRCLDQAVEAYIVIMNVIKGGKIH